MTYKLQWEEAGRATRLYFGGPTGLSDGQFDEFALVQGTLNDEPLTLFIWHQRLRTGAKVKIRDLNSIDHGFRDKYGTVIEDSGDGMKVSVPGFEHPVELLRSMTLDVEDDIND